MTPTKRIAINALLVVCMIMSLGGAVNSGMTYFFMAIPFAGYLCWVAKGSKKHLTFAIFFVLLCVLVSVTRDANPFIFPIISNGTALVAKDGFYRAFDDGSGSFTEYKDITLNEPNPQQKNIIENFIVAKDVKTVTIPDTDSRSGGSLTLTKLSKGEVYPITGIYHEGFDLGEYQSVKTSIGMFPLSDINEGYFILNKPIQSKWSKILGNLMYWPIAPIALGSMFK